MEGRLMLALLQQLLLFTIHQVGSQDSANTGFIEQPTTVEILPLVDARFYCKHLSANIIDWSVNGTLLTVHHPPNITAISTSINGEILHQLIIQANGGTQYNDTTIRCVAIFLSTSPPTEVVTPPARLTIIAIDQTKPFPNRFIVTPMPLEQNLVVGEQIEYRCHPCEADNIRWIVNGTLIGNNFPAGFYGNYSLETNNRTQLCSQRLLLTLQITDLHLYNNTVVWCVASSLSPTREMHTSPTSFKVQGKLGGVTNLARIAVNSSTEHIFGWDPPFSLDLTNADPDIVYCVNIDATSCGERILVFQGCGLTLNYTNMAFNSDGLYNVNVTAQSNIVEATNGPATTVDLTEKYIFFEHSTTTNRVTRITDNMSVIIEINKVMQQQTIKPQNFSILLEAINDPLHDPKNCAAFGFNASDAILMLDVFCPVEPRMLFKSRIMHTECGALSDDLELSTYDIQNISVVATNQPGEVVVTYYFIPEGTASGLLLIAYSDSDDTDVHLTVENLQLQPRADSLTITGLLSDTYTFSVFCIEDNGLPLNSTAGIPRRVSGITGTQVPNTNSGESQNVSDDGSQITINNERNCISCHFLDNVSSCVAITFMKASRLRLSESKTNTRGLFGIEVHQVTEQLDSGEYLICIELDFSNYSIAVFRYDNRSGFLGNKPLKLFYSTVDVPEHNTTTTSRYPLGPQSLSGLSIIPPVVLAAAVAGLLLLIVVIFFICGYIYHHHNIIRKENDNNILEVEEDRSTLVTISSDSVGVYKPLIMTGPNADNLGLNVHEIFERIKLAAPKWKELGEHLSNSQCNLLDYIDTEGASEEECLQRILEVYDQKQSMHNGQTKLDKIVDALKKCGQEQLAANFNFFSIPGTPMYGSQQDINTPCASTEL